MVRCIFLQQQGRLGKVRNYQIQSTTYEDCTGNNHPIPITMPGIEEIQEPEEYQKWYRQVFGTPGFVIPMIQAEINWVLNEFFDDI
jgi:hypothetical protein